MNTENKIERIAMINAANDIMPISENLKQERAEILKALIEGRVARLGYDRGIEFIGPDREINKSIYLDSYNNF